MIRLLIVIAILFAASSAFSQVNVEATGYDWVQMEDAQKTELIKTLYYIFKIDTDKYPVEGGVQSMNGLYWIWIKDHAEEAKKLPPGKSPEGFEEFFGEYVFMHLAEVLIYDGAPPTKEMLAEYGMKNVADV